MKKLHILLMGIMAALAVGCSSPKPKTEEAKDEVAAAKVHAEAAKAKQEVEQKRLETALTVTPAWALTPPKPDETGVYAVGMGESNKLRISLRKAMLDAEFELAKLYNQELSGSERYYAQDNHGAISAEQYTAIIDKLVSQVPVVGFEVLKQEVQTVDATYNAYVLVKLPYAQFNKVLRERQAQTKDRVIAQAFADLERRLNKRREQLAEEAKREAEQIAAQAAAIPQATDATPGATQSKPDIKAETHASPAPEVTAKPLPPESADTDKGAGGYLSEVSAKASKLIGI